MPEHLDIDTKPNKIDKFHQFYLQKFKNEKFPLFSIIEFNLHGSCSRRCAFFPRVDEKKWPDLNEELEDKLFEKILLELKELNYTGRIAFSGFSEPMMHSNLVGLIERINFYLPNSSPEIITNGDFLNEDILQELFNNGLKYMYVSIYTNKKTEQKFINMKNNLNLSDEKFEIRPRNLGKKMNFGLNINNRAGAVDYTRFGLKQEKELPLKQQCFYPMYTLFIDYNGDCLMCPDDWDKKNIIGNIKNEKIFDIWVKTKLHQVRKSLLNADRSASPCDKCDVNGLVNGKEFADKWQEYYKS